MYKTCIHTYYVRIYVHSTYRVLATKLKNSRSEKLRRTFHNNAANTRAACTYAVIYKWFICKGEKYPIFIGVYIHNK